ncbi:MAG TPA: CFI-box-CTERM domain-containing protein [Candidatus Nitrosotenuis sp.]|nr:CFI-box-CTERM domain-containing protein [Candidatus Nitrosotenuis sp.]
MILVGLTSVSHADEVLSSNDTDSNYGESPCPPGTVLKDRLCVVIDPNVPPFNQRDCLIATASFGSEMAPQVQMLREIRDKVVLKTYSGILFMNGFNVVYYSFSPSIAELENKNPIFKETVKMFITPMISALSIMTFAEEGSELQVIVLGISTIVLVIGMYFVIPSIVLIKIRNRFRS